MKAHPTSALAHLVGRGTTYTRALTAVPSDSFSGMVAQVTGGNPGTSGIYYDDSYNQALLPAGIGPRLQQPRAFQDRDLLPPRWTAALTGYAMTHGLPGSAHLRDAEDSRGKGHIVDAVGINQDATSVPCEEPTIASCSSAVSRGLPCR